MEDNNVLESNESNHAESLSKALESIMPFCQCFTTEQIEAWANAKAALLLYRGEQ